MLQPSGIISRPAYLPGRRQYLDVSFEAFKQNSRVIRVPGFHDGAGVYKVRFMPDNEGEWTLHHHLERTGTRRPGRRLHRRRAGRG